MTRHLQNEKKLDETLTLELFLHTQGDLWRHRRVQRDLKRDLKRDLVTLKQTSTHELQAA